MVKPSMRTRSVKKVKRRTPGGRTATHYKHGKVKKSVCGRCGAELGGVVSGTPFEVSKTPRQSRVPSRPYGGVLCGNCLDDLVRYATRMEVKHSHSGFSGMGVDRNLTLEKFLPRGWFQQVSSGKARARRGKTKQFKKASAAAAPKKQAAKKKAKKEKK